MKHIEAVKEALGANNSETVALMDELEDSLGFGLTIRSPINENSYILRDGDAQEITIPREAIPALLTYINNLEAEEA
jgi:hypothetical protein